MVRPTNTEWLPTLWTDSISISRTRGANAGTGRPNCLDGLVGNGRPLKSNEKVLWLAAKANAIGGCSMGVTLRAKRPAVCRNCAGIFEAVRANANCRSSTSPMTLRGNMLDRSAWATLTSEIGRGQVKSTLIARCSNMDNLILDLLWRCRHI